MRLMSTRIDGRSRRKFSIGTRLCPPAMILASPPACASDATAASTLSATMILERGRLHAILLPVLTPGRQANPPFGAALSRLTLRQQIVLQRHGARAALDQAVDDAGQQLEFLAAEAAELDVVDLPLDRREPLERGAALAPRRSASRGGGRRCRSACG